MSAQGNTTPLQPSQVADHSARECAAFLSEPWSFNAAIHAFAAGARRITDEQPAAGASAGARGIRKSIHASGNQAGAQS